MPSGAKKRKAAKKKQSTTNTSASSSSSSTLSLGGQDLKPIDEKESDGGSLNSPASSQDYNIHHQPFSEQQDEEVEKGEDTTSVRSIVTESEGGVNIDSKLKPKEDFESQNVTNIDWEKEVQDGSSSRSSSSSSSDNDESNVIEKKIVVVETSPLAVDSIKQIADTSVKEIESSVESHDEVVSMSKKVLGDNCVDSVEVIESDLKDKVDEIIGSQTEEDTLDTVVSTSPEYLASSSLDVNGSKSVAQESEEKPLLPDNNDSNVGASNGKEHVKKTTDCSIKEPLIASAPLAVQTTSWKGCCGLFALFSGSDR